jgi:hypothetical protein
MAKHNWILEEKPTKTVSVQESNNLKYYVKIRNFWRCLIGKNCHQILRRRFGRFVPHSGCCFTNTRARIIRKQHESPRIITIKEYFMASWWTGWSYSSHPTYRKNTDTITDAYSEINTRCFTRRPKQTTISSLRCLMFLFLQFIAL